MACYHNLISRFRAETDVEHLSRAIEKGADGFPTSAKQWDVWKTEIELLQRILPEDFNNSRIIFEYTIPRIHMRLDVALLHHGHVFVLEFKGHEHNAKRVNGVTKKNKEQVEQDIDR